MSASPPAARGAFRAVGVALVAAATALQAAGVVRRNVHWDEFIFLARVHTWLRGEALPVFQTGYVHLFTWLGRMGGTEIVQVQAGRGVLLALWGLSLLLLYRLARSVVDRPAALAAVVLAATLREDVVHAASFRIDGVMAPVFLGACVASLRPTRRRAALAGALSGLLLFLSLKAVLLLPVVAALAWVHRDEEAGWGAPLLSGVLSFAVAAAALFAVHASALPPGDPPAGGPATPWAFLWNAGDRMLLRGGLFPRWEVLARTLLDNAPLWAVVGMGAGLAAADLRAREHARRGLACLVLVAPLAFLAVYRNFWPYAFVSLAPTAWVAGGRGWWWLASGPGRARRAAGWGVAAWTALSLTAAGRELARDGLALQRQTLAVVHARFPEAVPYLDRTGMVSTFPRPLFNMTTFGMETYRARGEAAVARYIETVRPRFLIVNTSSLDVFPGGPYAPTDERPPLLPDDARAVREAFAHYWGPVFLAGRSWETPAPDVPLSFPVGVPGPYTLLAPGPVLLDGIPLAPGEARVLERGSHGLVPLERYGRVRLLYGAGVAEPPFPPAPGPLFAGF